MQSQQPSSQKLGWGTFIQQAWSELHARPLYYLALLLVLLVALSLSSATIYISQSRPLSPLEQAVVQLLLLFLTFMFSWQLAKRGEEKAVLKSQKSLARSAMRRINGLAKSTSRLRGNIQGSKKEITSGSDFSKMENVPRRLLSEMYDGLETQVAEIHDNIQASVEDWRDILPEEFERGAEAERRILDAREVALKERNELVEAFREQIAQGKFQTSDEVQILVSQQVENVEKRLSVQIEQIRSELTPFAPTGNVVFRSVGSVLADPGDNIVWPGVIGMDKIELPEVDVHVIGAMPREPKPPLEAKESKKPAKPKKK